MKAPLIALGLALSVLFNVFFLAGYLQARRAAADAGRGQEITERVRGELGLDPAQLALFDDLRRSWREESQAYAESMALIRQDMVEELDRNPPDPVRMGEVLDRESELRRQWRSAEADRFGDFLEALTPEQRRKLMGHLQRGGPPHGEMLRRFDANHNGTLEPQERAAAREAMGSRWRAHRRPPAPGGGGGGEGGPGAGGPGGGEMAPGDGARGEGYERRSPPGGRLRGELMRRFDADHDGALSAAEESALLEWIRERPADENP